MTIANTPQYVFTLHHCKGTLVTDTHFIAPQDPQAFSCKDAFLTASPLHGFSPSQLQDFAHVLGELQKVPVSPFLQAAEISLSCSPALQLSTYSTQPGGKETKTYRQQKNS